LLANFKVGTKKMKKKLTVYSILLPTLKYYFLSATTTLKKICLKWLL